MFDHRVCSIINWTPWSCLTFVSSYSRIPNRTILVQWSFSLLMWLCEKNHSNVSFISDLSHIPYFQYKRHCKKYFLAQIVYECSRYVATQTHNFIFLAGRMSFCEFEWKQLIFTRKLSFIYNNNFWANMCSKDEVNISQHSWKWQNKTVYEIFWRRVGFLVM